MSLWTTFITLCVFSIGFGLVLGCEKKVDDKTRYCRKLHDYHLQFILQSSHTDKQNRVCCAGFELIDCILESGSDTNCTEVSQDLAAPEKVFHNETYCMTYARSNCKDIVCNVEEFERLSEKCYDTYNANVIHVLEDPEINNKSAVLCCELSIRGRCVLHAAAETDCEGRPVDFRQPPGLTRAYGDCDFLTQVPCSAPRHLSIYLAFLLPIVALIQRNKF